MVQAARVSDGATTEVREILYAGPNLSRMHLDVRLPAESGEQPHHPTTLAAAATCQHRAAAGRGPGEGSPSPGRGNPPQTGES